MSYEIKPNSGMSFKIKEKKSPTHSDYSGTINVDGKDYWINTWIKLSKKNPGEKYLSHSVSPKQVTANSIDDDEL